ncbi:MAG: sulfate respiration complex protein HmcD [bacterium]
MIFDQIHTLQEYMTSTKAVSYLIALLYLIAFPIFWRFLVAREKGQSQSPPA